MHTRPGKRREPGSQAVLLVARPATSFSGPRNSRCIGDLSARQSRRPFRLPVVLRDEELLEQLQERDYVGLVLSRELDREIRGGREQVRVERGDLLECLRAVVMKVGSGLRHAPKRRNIEHAGKEHRMAK